MSLKAFVLRLKSTGYVFDLEIVDVTLPALKVYDPTDKLLVAFERGKRYEQSNVKNIGAVSRTGTTVTTINDIISLPVTLFRERSGVVREKQGTVLVFKKHVNEKTKKMEVKTMGVALIDLHELSEAHRKQMSLNLGRTGATINIVVTAKPAKGGQLMTSADPLPISNETSPSIPTSPENQPHVLSPSSATSSDPAPASLSRGITTPTRQRVSTLQRNESAPSPAVRARVEYADVGLLTHMTPPSSKPFRHPPITHLSGLISPLTENTALASLKSYPTNKMMQGIQDLDESVPEVHVLAAGGTARARGEWGSSVDGSLSPRPDCSPRRGNRTNAYQSLSKTPPSTNTNTGNTISQIPEFLSMRYDKLTDQTPSRLGQSLSSQLQPTVSTPEIETYFQQGQQQQQWLQASMRQYSLHASDLGEQSAGSILKLSPRSLSLSPSPEKEESIGLLDGRILGDLGQKAASLSMRVQGAGIGSTRDLQDPVLRMTEEVRALRDELQTKPESLEFEIRRKAFLNWLDALLNHLHRMERALMVDTVKSFDGNPTNLIGNEHTTSPTRKSLGDELFYQRCDAGEEANLSGSAVWEQAELEKFLNVPMRRADNPSKYTSPAAIDTNAPLTAAHSGQEISSAFQVPSTQQRQAFDSTRASIMSLYRGSNYNPFDINSASRKLPTMSQMGGIPVPSMGGSSRFSRESLRDEYQTYMVPVSGDAGRGTGARTKKANAMAAIPCMDAQLRVPSITAAHNAHADPFSTKPGRRRSLGHGYGQEATPVPQLPYGNNTMGRKQEIPNVVQQSRAHSAFSEVTGTSYRPQQQNKFQDYPASQFNAMSTGNVRSQTPDWINDFSVATLSTDSAFPPASVGTAASVSASFPVSALNTNSNKYMSSQVGQYSEVDTVEPVRSRSLVGVYQHSNPVSVYAARQAGGWKGDTPPYHVSPLKNTNTYTSPPEKPAPALEHNHNGLDDIPAVGHVNRARRASSDGEKSLPEFSRNSPFGAGTTDNAAIDSAIMFAGNGIRNVDRNGSVDPFLLREREDNPLAMTMGHSVFFSSPSTKPCRPAEYARPSPSKESEANVIGTTSTMLMMSNPMMRGSKNPLKQRRSSSELHVEGDKTTTIAAMDARPNESHSHVPSQTEVERDYADVYEDTGMTSMQMVSTLAPEPSDSSGMEVSQTDKYKWFDELDSHTEGAATEGIATEKFASSLSQVESQPASLPSQVAETPDASESLTNAGASGGMTAVPNFEYESQSAISSSSVSPLGALVDDVQNERAQNASSGLKVSQNGSHVNERVMSEGPSDAVLEVPAAQPSPDTATRPRPMAPKTRPGGIHGSASMSQKSSKSSPVRSPISSLWSGKLRQTASMKTVSSPPMDGGMRADRRIQSLRVSSNPNDLIVSDSSSAQVRGGVDASPDHGSVIGATAGPLGGSTTNTPAYRSTRSGSKEVRWQDDASPIIGDVNQEPENDTLSDLSLSTDHTKQVKGKALHPLSVSMPEEATQHMDPEGAGEGAEELEDVDLFSSPSPPLSPTAAETRLMNSAFKIKSAKARAMERTADHSLHNAYESDDVGLISAGPEHAQRDSFDDTEGTLWRSAGGTAVRSPTNSCTSSSPRSPGSVSRGSPTSRSGSSRSRSGSSRSQRLYYKPPSAHMHSGSGGSRRGNWREDTVEEMYQLDDFRNRNSSDGFVSGPTSPSSQQSPSSPKSPSSKTSDPKFKEMDISSISVGAGPIVSARPLPSAVDGGSFWPTEASADKSVDDNGNNDPGDADDNGSRHRLSFNVSVPDILDLQFQQIDKVSDI